MDKKTAMPNLPLYASIAKSQRRLFDAQYLASDSKYADLVCCVNCSRYGYIELGANSCPACGCTDCLMGIQESDIKESDDE